jgi:putative membrane protein
MRRYLLVVSAVALLGACHKAPTASETAASDAAAAAAASDQMAQSSAMAAASSATAAAGSASNAAANATANTAGTSDFVTGAAASDMYEIQAAKIALQRSHNAGVKMFARMMIKDHTASTNALKAAIGSSGRTDLTPPAMLPSDKQSMIDDLNQASAADFDLTYMNQQIAAHQATLELINGYANGGDVDALKGFAAKTAPVVQAHLNQAQSVKDTLKQ